jgi:hypothetical protein
MPSAKKNEVYSEKEAASRRDAIIERMIAMPPKPHSEMKLGKHKGKKAASSKAGQRKSQK